VVGVTTAVTENLRAAPAEPPVGDGPTWAERIAWTLAGVALINWSVQLLTASTSYAWVAAMVVLSGAWGLATVVSSWLPLHLFPSVRRWSRPLAWATALVLIATLAAWCYTQVRLGPGYGTDELAFDQYAAMLTQHGQNPYVHSMAPAFSMFQVSPDGFTYTMAGRAVTSMSYPALSFLLYLPLLALGWSTQMAVVVNVGAWAIAILLLFALLPPRMRAAGLVLGSVSVYVSYAVGGVTDALYIPLLIGAAYRWDRFGTTRRSYLGPVLLGLAMAVKQTPWLIFLFVLLGLFAQAQGSDSLRAGLRLSLRYAAVTLSAFLAPNLPFIVMNASAWWRGILIPVTGHLVPAGQGAIALSLFMRIGGGSLAAFTAATVTLGLLVAVIYVGTFPLLRPVAFILPAIVLFFAARSYGNYLAALVPAALVGAFTTAPAVLRPRLAHGSVRWHARLTRGWLLGGAAAGCLFLGSLGWALLDRAPLQVNVISVRTTGQLATIEQLKIRVTNRTNGPRSPRFTVNEGGGITTFWRVAQGPKRLGGHETALYTLQAPNFQAQPSISGGFSVMALTRGPDAMSVSGPYIPSTVHIALDPNAINSVVPLGTPVYIRARLLDQLDRPVHRLGMAVYLGQIIYDQSGLEYGEAEINHSNPGQTPVTAYTNAQGVATFEIVNAQPSGDPLYFEANLVNSRYFFPYGYSAILPIRFGK
jgi:hypothetical protein